MFMVPTGLWMRMSSAYGIQDGGRYVSMPVLGLQEVSLWEGLEADIVVCWNDGLQTGRIMFGLFDKHWTASVVFLR